MFFLLGGPLNNFSEQRKRPQPHQTRCLPSPQVRAELKLQSFTGLSPSFSFLQTSINVCTCCWGLSAAWSVRSRFVWRWAAREGFICLINTSVISRHRGLYNRKSGNPSPPKPCFTCPPAFICALYLRTSSRHNGESLFLYQVHLLLYFTFLNS